MASSKRGSGRGGLGGRESRSVVQAMRAANRGRGGGRRSSGFEVSVPSATGAASLEKLFRQARATGSLNLTSRGLEEIPEQVFHLLDGVDAAGGEKFWEARELQRLDLSFNRIARLPPQVSNLAVLLSLKMRKNQLISVPPEVFLIETLTLLDLTGNAIRELPEEQLGAAVVLKGLLLSGNRLSSLPPTVGQLEVLETLELAGNTLRSLPESIGRLKRLTSLTVSDNGLTRLPESIGGLSAVALLDVSRNAVERVPEGLARLGSLTSLDLRENKLSDFPSLPQSDRLAQVFVGFNMLAVVDGGVLLRVSGGLTEFHAQNNRIVHLPEEVGSLARLKTLDVSNNELAELPAALGYLPELNRLAVEGNPLRTIRRSLLSGPASSLKKYLRTRGPCPSYPGLDAVDMDNAVASGAGELSDDALQAVVRTSMGTGTLDLEGRGLTSLAAGLFDNDRALAAVTRAKLSDNKFQTLPRDIARFHKLSALQAENNKLSSLPATLAHLSLERLSLRRNSLSSSEVVDVFLTPPPSPPGSLPLSRSIRDLDLSSNGLGEVPRSIFWCRGLQTLALGFNALSSLSGLPWAALSALDNLDLSSNQLRNLGDVVLMTWLRRLNLENNEINPVPVELGLCTGLESLLLAGNPQRQVSPSLLERGTAATLDYLRDRLPPNHRPRTFETPPPVLAVETVGDGGAGLTAMAKGSSGDGCVREGEGDKEGAEEDQQGVAEAKARIAALQAEVRALSDEAEAPGMSQAKAYAVKKKLQMKRAAVMREERALKQALRGR